METNYEPETELEKSFAKKYPTLWGGKPIEKPKTKCCVEGCCNDPVYTVMDHGRPIFSCVVHGGFRELKEVDNVYTLTWWQEDGGSNRKIVILRFTKGKGEIVADVTEQFNWLVANSDKKVDYVPQKQAL